MLNDEQRTRLKDKYTNLSIHMRCCQNLDARNMYKDFELILTI